MRKRVLVFGTFDGIHAGHEFFLKSAKARGTELIVGVARDVHVIAFKGRTPANFEMRRLRDVESLPYVDSARLCDSEISSFQIIEEVVPDLIVLGHDQHELEVALISWMARSGHHVSMIQMDKLIKPMKEIEIAVGICERDGKILLIHRRDSNNPLWDKHWEFPGGKLEAGESPESAVRREVTEETGLPILDLRFFHLHHHDWHLPDRVLRVHLHCFHCLVGKGDVHIEDEKAYAYAWPNPDEALLYDCLSANIDILQIFLHAHPQNMG